MKYNKLFSVYEFLKRHRHYFNQKRFRQSAVIGLLMFSVSLVINRSASLYATAQASNSVSDLLLDHLPVMNVEWIVNDLAALFGFFMFSLVLWQPRRIPFVLKSVALFITVRALFIVFTHLAPFPVHAYLDPNDIFRTLTYGGDYFFSGHSGMPYLFALIYWQEKLVRRICLSAAILFGFAVILGHLHYSIDVFAAFFITYGIFAMAQRFFPYAYHVFSEREAMPKDIEVTSPLL